VVSYYSLIPVRADRRCGPSDFKRSGHMGLLDTVSLKWVCLSRLIKI
jgi:hypothetical protein